MDPSEHHPRGDRGLIDKIRAHPLRVGVIIASFMIIAMYNLPWLTSIFRHRQSVEPELQARSERLQDKLIPDGLTDLPGVLASLILLGICGLVIWGAAKLFSMFAYTQQGRDRIRFGVSVVGVLAVFIAFSAASGGPNRVTDWGITTRAPVPAFQITSLQVPTCTTGYRVEQGDKAWLHDEVRGLPGIGWIAQPDDPAWDELSLLSIAAIGPDLRNTVPQGLSDGKVLKRHPITGKLLKEETFWIVPRISDVEVLSFMVVDEATMKLEVVKRLRNESPKTKAVFDRCGGFTHRTDSFGGGVAMRARNGLRLALFNNRLELTEGGRTLLEDRHLEEIQDPDFLVDGKRSAFALARQNFATLYCRMLAESIRAALRAEGSNRPVACRVVWDKSAKLEPKTEDDIPVELSKPY